MTRIYALTSFSFAVIRFYHLKKFWSSAVEIKTRLFTRQYSHGRLGRRSSEKSASIPKKLWMHCGMKFSQGGSLGVIIRFFPLHCSLWNIQSKKHLSAYFQMLWDHSYPILTHFYWIQRLMSLEHKGREFWENQVKNNV